MKISNIITLARLLLVVPVVAVYLLDFSYHQIIAVAIFTFAGCLDVVDGYIARKMNQETSIGAALDHIADKILISSILIAMSYQMQSIVITVCTIIIIIREFFISGLREHMAAIGGRDLVKVDWFGKLKTFIQIGAVFWAIIFAFAGLPMWTSETMIVIATIMTVVSAGLYLYNLSKVDIQINRNK